MMLLEFKTKLTLLYQFVEIYCVCMNSSKPSLPLSRPRPDCMLLPNGTAGSGTRPRLWPSYRIKLLGDT